MFKNFIFAAAIFIFLGCPNLKASHIEDQIAKDQAFKKSVNYERFSDIAPIFMIGLDCDSPILEALYEANYYRGSTPSSDEVHDFLRQMKAYQNDNQGAHYPLSLSEDKKYSLNVLASKYFQDDGSWVQELRINMQKIKILPRLLGQLKGLTKLYLSHNPLRDPSPLENLQALTHLNLNNTQVADISPLQNLVNLINLGLMSTHVTELSPLQNLRNLKIINLHNTPAMSLNNYETTLALFSPNVKVVYR